MQILTNKIEEIKNQRNELFKNYTEKDKELKIIHESLKNNKNISEIDQLQFKDVCQNAAKIESNVIGLMNDWYYDSEIFGPIMKSIKYVEEKNIDTFSSSDHNQV